MSPSEPSEPSTEPLISGFEQLSLSPSVLKAVREIGYETPSPIQQQSIPVLLSGTDLIGQAQTGTGKTAAFALPLLSKLDLSVCRPQILVLAPTRELALQVAEAFQSYAHHMEGFHVLPVYGGQGMGTQLRALKRGVHVVVGTPGRLMDHLRRKTLVLDKLTAVVLDEADEMLRMGFIEDVEQILEQTPEQRQVALFSATMPEPIRKVARRHLHDPVEIKVKTKTTTVSTIEQRYWQVTGLHKLDALTRILEVEPFDAVLIFVRTKTATVELADKLEARGYASSALNGDMNQNLRENTVERLKRKELDIIVATDVAARGLDVERISHVINYDIPYDTEAYVHRIGRTGRAGRTGVAILFVAPREKRLLRAIEQATKQPLKLMQMPTHKDLADHRIGLFKQQLSDTIEACDLGAFEELVEQYQQEHNVSLSEVAAALAYLVQRGRPLHVKADGKQSGKEDNGERGMRDKPARNRREAPPAHEQSAIRPQKRENAPPRERNKAHKDGRPAMLTYRIEVGREHDVSPRNIVGAIANETDLGSHLIGDIKLYETYSTVDLPEGMPKEIFQHLQKVWVCGQQLRISLAGKPTGTDTLSLKKRTGRKPGVKSHSKRDKSLTPKKKSRR